MCELEGRLHAAELLRDSLQTSLGARGFFVHHAVRFRGSGRGDEVCVVAEADIPAGTVLIRVPDGAKLSYRSARDPELALAPGGGFADLDAVLRAVAAAHVELLERQLLRRRADARAVAGAAADHDAPALLRPRLSPGDAAMAVLVMRVLALSGQRDGRWARVAATWPTRAALARLPLLWRDTDAPGADARGAAARVAFELRAEAHAVFARCVAPALARVGDDARAFCARGSSARDTWAWALGLVTSRSHDDGAARGGGTGAILPLVDLFDGLPRGQ